MRHFYRCLFTQSSVNTLSPSNTPLRWHKPKDGCLTFQRRRKHIKTVPDIDKEAVLYVHWPYCARRCTYCNFNKYISKSVNESRMSQCLSRETTTLLNLSGVEEVRSIFFGGGTPSLAEPSTIARVVQTVKDNVTFMAGSEVTLEANPTHLEVQKLREFKDAGVNRLSVGVQALNQSDLTVLGRDHSVDEALRFISEAKLLFPGRVSVDMIFGRPGQTVKAWEQELQTMLNYCDDHVSLYQLTLERGTQLFKWVQQNKYSLPETDIMAEMYNTAVQLLQSHGYNRYEISNFARPRAESQHNQSYWAGKQYIGVGPGAHGRFTPWGKWANNSGETTPAREARIQTLEPDNWLYEVEKFGHATRKVTQLSLIDQLQELVALGLRTKTGLPQTRWESVYPQSSLLSVFGHSERVQALQDDGLINVDKSGLVTTPAGMLVLDSVIPHLLVSLSDHFDKQTDHFAKDQVT